MLMETTNDEWISTILLEKMNYASLKYLTGPTHLRMTQINIMYFT